ncbi:CPBP family intramembrane glutamic endopeptidase [Lipingzhangella sp. LS1_29]|uniref:CPBP family intramembrane glutamic endopeptidase n=1 Tax=Lipingzhangella rawalii TaxID=2055835 RepID=A0ABU2HA47_9ACTN|nr:CPBP family intramembrane glutamic endopeptidase [Lipingzhangella rawalii]MDS1272182.1 CPBP family intramembrane glutamic endopeptidase [Lipingzhangella rawalii]
MPWSETDPGLSAIAFVLAVILLVYTALGQPLLGWWLRRWVERRRQSTPGALRRFYLVTVAVQTSWIVLAALILLTSPQLTASDLGLRIPHAWLPIAAGALGLGAALGAIWLIDWARSRAGERRSRGESTDPAADLVSVLSPHTRPERRLYGASLIVAGVAEEVLYRALLPVILVVVGLPWWIAVAAAVVLFALAHVYQGWWGLVGPGLFGALLMALYIGTGSLLVPILVHLGVAVWTLARTGRGRRHR